MRSIPKKKTNISLLVGAFAVVSGAGAQVPSTGGPAIESITRPGEDRPRLLEPVRPGDQPSFVLPPLAPPEKARDVLSSGVRIRVSGFRFEGNTVFSAEELGKLVARFENAEIGNEELEEARLAITRHYVSAGYINSGAVIPDQKVVDGIITMRIVEGQLTTIEIAGENAFQREYLTSRIRQGSGPPLNVGALQTQLQIMLLNPQIERLNAELKPGARPGESVLGASVTEAKRFRVGLGIANNRAPSVGGERLEISAGINNLLGLSDSLGLRLGKTDGVDDAGFNFSVPINSRDTTLSLRWDKNDTTVVEAPFRSIDVKGSSETSEISLNHPFYRTVFQELSGGLGVVNRKSRTYLLGVPFSFAPGVQDGRSEVSAARFSMQWVERSVDSVLALRWTWSVGLDAFGSTINRDGTPDSRFVTRLGQVQWVRRVGTAGAQFVARGEFQLSNGGLLPLEKYAVGGVDSVRGYRENLFIRDAGWSASAEYRHPVARVPVPFLGDAPGDGEVKLAAFVDAGRAWDDQGGAIRTISSVGGGVRWDIAPEVYVHLYKGVALRRVQVQEHDIQDSGVHFRLGVQKRF